MNILVERWITWTKYDLFSSECTMLDWFCAHTGCCILVRGMDPNYTHFWNLNFSETIQPNSAWFSLPMCMILILSMKENWTPQVEWFFRKKGGKVASKAHQSFNQSSNNMGVRIVWCKKGVRMVWVHPSYRCTATLTRFCVLIVQSIKRNKSQMAFASWLFELRTSLVDSL